jgi:hypothetical protein
MMALAYNYNKKDFLYVFFLLYIIIIIGFVDSFEPIIISTCILITYLLYKPNNFLHPNNMIFAFSSLYVVLPTFVYYYFEFYNIEYILPWGKLYEWDSLSKLTYYNMLFIFIIPFYSFKYFTRDVENIKHKLRFKKLKISTFSIFIIAFFSILCLIIFIFKTGGVNNWIYDYQYTYLVLREGNGFINLITIFLVNILIFLIGVKLFQKNRNYFVLFLILSIILITIFTFSYFQGFKSRFIILSIILFFPVLVRLKLSYKNILLFVILFFSLVSLGNYLRSDGFYDSGRKLLEYSLTYLNVYPIHDLILKDFELNLFQTIHHVFVKPLIIIGLLPSDEEFDLSIMLTKIYFPNDWTMKATQQWPLMTELHLNYYGMLLGWIPLVLYAYVISYIYNKMLLGRIELSLIYLLEMIRIFSTFRSVLLPWNLPFDIFIYILYFYVLKLIIRKNENEN